MIRVSSPDIYSLFVFVTFYLIMLLFCFLFHQVLSHYTCIVILSLWLKNKTVHLTVLFLIEDFQLTVLHQKRQKPTSRKH